MKREGEKGAILTRMGKHTAKPSDALNVSCSGRGPEPCVFDQFKCPLASFRVSFRVIGCKYPAVPGPCESVQFRLGAHRHASTHTCSTHARARAHTHTHTQSAGRPPRPRLAWPPHYRPAPALPGRRPAPGGCHPPSVAARPPGACPPCPRSRRRAAADGARAPAGPGAAVRRRPA